MSAPGELPHGAFPILQIVLTKYMDTNGETKYGAQAMGAPNDTQPPLLPDLLGVLEYGKIQIIKAYDQQKGNT